MTPDQSERIISKLAGIEEAQMGLRRDFEQERDDSHASRRELHAKVNGVVEGNATVRGDIRVLGEVVAQTRESVKSLQEAVELAAPTIVDVENAKKFGAWVLGGGAAAAIGAGLAIFAWGESLKGWLAHWLGIK